MIRNSSGTERAAPFPLLPQAEAIPCQGLMLVRLQGERAGCALAGSLGHGRR